MHLMSSMPHSEYWGNVIDQCISSYIVSVINILSNPCCCIPLFIINILIHLTYWSFGVLGFWGVGFWVSYYIEVSPSKYTSTRLAGFYRIVKRWWLGALPTFSSLAAPYKLHLHSNNRLSSIITASPQLSPIFSSLVTALPRLSPHRLDTHHSEILSTIQRPWLRKITSTIRGVSIL